MAGPRHPGAFGPPATLPSHPDDGDEEKTAIDPRSQQANATHSSGQRKFRGLAHIIRRGDHPSTPGQAAGAPPPQTTPGTYTGTSSRLEDSREVLLTPPGDHRVASGKMARFNHFSAAEGTESIDELTVEDHARPLPPPPFIEQSEQEAEGGQAIASLVVTAGNDLGRRFALRTDRLTIGRGMDNDVVLTDISVSRHHLLVERSGADFTIEDVGSGNGTLVNDREQDGRYRLLHGDRIELGNTVLRFDHNVGARAHGAAVGTPTSAPQLVAPVVPFDEVGLNSGMRAPSGRPSRPSQLTDEPSTVSERGKQGGAGPMQTSALPPPPPRPARTMPPDVDQGMVPSAGHPLGQSQPGLAQSSPGLADSYPPQSAPSALPPAELAFHGAVPQPGSNGHAPTMLPPALLDDDPEEPPTQIASVSSVRPPPPAQVPGMGAPGQPGAFSTFLPDQALPSGHLPHEPVPPPPSLQIPYPIGIPSGGFAQSGPQSVPGTMPPHMAQTANRRVSPRGRLVIAIISVALGLTGIGIAAALVNSNSNSDADEETASASLTAAETDDATTAQDKPPADNSDSTEGGAAQALLAAAGDDNAGTDDDDPATEDSAAVEQPANNGQPTETAATPTGAQPQPTDPQPAETDDTATAPRTPAAPERITLANLSTGRTTMPATAWGTDEAFLISVPQVAPSSTDTGDSGGKAIVPHDDFRREPAARPDRTRPVRTTTRTPPRRRDPPPDEEEEDDYDDQDDEPPPRRGGAGSAGAAKKQAKVLYRQMKFSEAADLLRDTADQVDHDSAADDLYDLASSYGQVGTLMNAAQRAKRSDAPAALRAYQKARSYDADVGDGVHRSLINARIGQVAPIAAGSYMAKHKYADAREAAEIAADFGGAARVGAIFNSLESKAEAKYKKAEAAMDDGDDDKALKLVNEIISFAPRDSDVYSDAKKLKKKLR